MLFNPYVIAAVVVLLIVIGIGSWYLSSSSESEAPAEYDQGVAGDTNLSVEAAPNDAMDVYDTYPSETDTTAAMKTETDTTAAMKNETTIATESTTTTTTAVSTEDDATNVEDVVPSEQIEFINNKQSQIKTFLSTEFGFLNSLNA